jgi:hypothetical protein
VKKLKATFLTLVLPVALSVPGPCFGQSASQADRQHAHACTMMFLQGVRLAALSEGKQMLQKTQWITGAADRGLNYYFRPDYTEVTSLYASLFDTDFPTVKGYKEYFDMKATTKSGAPFATKYLVIAYKDLKSGEWKVIYSTHGADIDNEVRAFKENLNDTRYSSPKDNYLIYAHWLVRAGHLAEAKAALETAREKAGGDSVSDSQIQADLDVIAKITPNPSR